jgi:hypothetical protein
MSTDDVDAWIAQLMQCKPLSEVEVKKLCEKVSLCSGPVVDDGCFGKGKEKGYRVVGDEMALRH